MIVKIFPPVNGFPAVRYNTDKMDRGMGELMKVANFGALQGFSQLRPQDYKDYLMQLAGLNKRVVYPQFHATISAKGKDSSKNELTGLAEKWLEKMAYGKQPYLIVFHKDTDHNHVHLVTCRVDRDGKKISSAFEHNRAIQALNQLLGLDEDQVARKDLKEALAYRFSTKAQFAMVLESRGYVVKDDKLIKYGKHLLDIPDLQFSPINKQRASQLKALFRKYAQQYSTVLKPETMALPSGFVKETNRFHSDFSAFMEEKFGAELIFHAAKDKPVYGYTIIDHAQQGVFKGSEVMPLKALMEPVLVEERFVFEPAAVDSGPALNAPIQIAIADDVDDQQVHGRRRKKARKNTR